MNVKSIIAVALVALCVVVLASLGLSFTTPGKPIGFLGLHVAAADSEFVPPAAGALVLAGGMVLLILKCKRI